MGLMVESVTELRLQDEVDDLIGDEATEAADQEQVQAAIAAANLKARDEDIDPEALEQFIKDRFKAPQHVAASDFSEEGGTSTMILYQGSCHILG